MHRGRLGLHPEHAPHFPDRSPCTSEHPPYGASIDLLIVTCFMCTALELDSIRNLRLIEHCEVNILVPLWGHLLITQLASLSFDHVAALTLIEDL